MRFVECRDALMQILASLDRDKNSSVSVALGFSCVVTRREREVTYSQTLFCYEDHQSSLRVRRDLQSDLFYFYFYE